MLILHVTRAELDSALAEASHRFGENLAYAYEPRPTGSGFRLRLRAIDSRGPGGRISHRGRRVGNAACWHCHGVFFDNLPHAAVIHAAGRTIRPGDRWTDRNIGSMFQPVAYSDACDCGSDLARAPVRIMRTSDILRCRFAILVPSHYRPDGTCKCDDAAERARMIAEWGYTPHDFDGIPVR